VSADRRSGSGGRWRVSVTACLALTDPANYINCAVLRSPTTARASKPVLGRQYQSFVRGARDAQSDVRSSSLKAPRSENLVCRVKLAGRTRVLLVRDAHDRGLRSTQCSEKLPSTSPEVRTAAYNNRVLRAESHDSIGATGPIPRLNWTLAADGCNVLIVRGKGFG